MRFFYLHLCRVAKMFLARLLAFLLACVFAWAAAAKVLRSHSWMQALDGYRPPTGLRRPLALGVPAIEGGLALLLFTGQTRVGAALTLFACACFALAILRARLLQGNRLPCGCFGGSKERDFRLLLVRNFTLSAIATSLLIYGRDVRGYPSVPSGDGWVAFLLAALGVATLLGLYIGVRSGLRRGFIEAR
jgi:hypothetical protein